MNGTSTEIVSTEQCDISCPGDASEYCGGTRSVSGLARRQAIQDTILLTVYVNTNEAVGSTATTTASSVTTTVMTITTTTIVTSCSPADPSCTTGVPTTEVLTITSTCSSPETTSASCVGGYCGNAWTLQPYDGGVCSGEVVYIIESCDCASGSTYQPQLCVDDSCAGQIVYKPVQCTDADCSGEGTVCQPEACESCEGGVYFTPVQSQSLASSSRYVTATSTGSPAASTDSGSGTVPGEAETENYSSSSAPLPASTTVLAGTQETSVITSGAHRPFVTLISLFMTFGAIFLLQ